MKLVMDILCFRVAKKKGNRQPSGSKHKAKGSALARFFNYRQVKVKPDYRTLLTCSECCSQRLGLLETPL